MNAAMEWRLRETSDTWVIAAADALQGRHT